MVLGFLLASHVEHVGNLFLGRRFLGLPFFAFLVDFWIPLGAPNRPEIEFSAAGGRPERNCATF